ncbi:hypothetical protein C900_02325 [Fulvivirga imtechensis AK7]|uniref:Uncharacterized protein n=1 Tax=Fulvivirga imtechensis AK7 TaxID=1237149 RepID=L8JSD0_9BACT|nr:hypothetical protein [Fulvivirga imtechensis]ELR71740.1 hypothetical protein C900_02325 [Fulvivirga imtechensis AK7]
MKKPIIIACIVLVVLSLLFAFYQNQKANKWKREAIRTEKELNTKLTVLQDSLQLVKKDLEREKEKTKEAKKIAETMSKRFKESFDKL